jgi:hypothetical protein
MIRSALLVFVVVGLAGCTALRPETPPLLQNVTSQGGWWSNGCPPRSEMEASLADGRQASARVAAKFPVGSDAKALESHLGEVGFDKAAACEGDASIRHASFRQTGGGLYGPYPMFATVAWKTGEDGRILWTRANVTYTGL